MQQPDYGYNIKNSVFSKILSEFGINEGQLYPTLKKMELQKLIEKKIEYRDDGPNRHLFHITQAGVDEFNAWLESPAGEEKGFRYELIRRDPFLLKCMYFKYLDPPVAIEKINTHRSDVEKSLKEYGAAKADMENRGVDTERVLIVEYAIRAQEMRLQWLNDLKELISKDV